MLRALLTVCVTCALVVPAVQCQNQPAVSWPPLNPAASVLYGGLPSSPLDVQGLKPESHDSIGRLVKPTHWKEGGILGGLVLGGFSVWLSNEICEYAGEGQARGCGGKAVLGGLVGGGLGFLIGALIGGQFPKHAPASPAQLSDSTELH
jgi:hypothetical protein